MRERVRLQYNVIHEENVPMKNRDGLTLYADIVRPDAPGRYPVLVSRTPYGKDTAMQNTDGSAFFFAPQRLCHGDSGTVAAASPPMGSTTPW